MKLIFYLGGLLLSLNLFSSEMDRFGFGCSILGHRLSSFSFEDLEAEISHRDDILADDPILPRKLYIDVEKRILDIIKKDIDTRFFSRTSSGKYCDLSRERYEQCLRNCNKGELPLTPLARVMLVSCLFEQIKIEAQRKVCWNKFTEKHEILKSSYEMVYEELSDSK